MKRLLHILLAFFILMSITLTACSNVEEIDDREMDMVGRIRYTGFLNFERAIYMDGRWFYWDNDAALASKVNPNHGSFADFYTEVRIVRNTNEVIETETTVIFAFPNEDTVATVVNALNWEVDSEGIDLSDFGLTYPITVEDLLENYENVNRLFRRDRYMLGVMISRFASRYPEGSRIDFELVIMLQESRAEIIYGILDQLDMSHDEGARLLRAAGSVETFVAVTDLMLEEGFSAERALRRVR